MVISAGDQVSVGASWLADHSGDLTLRTITIRHVENPPLDNYGLVEQVIHVTRS
jgi:hypothetical protein